MFRLQAILHVAAGTVRANSWQGPGYCYMIGGGPISCLPGHVTRLLFCLYTKLFLPCIFETIDFWSSISCIVVDIELADINVSKLGVFIDGKVQGYSFRLQKNTNPQNKRSDVQEKCTALCGKSRCLDLNELRNLLSRDVKGENLAKDTETYEILGNFWKKEVENFDDHGCPKNWDFVDPKADEQIRIWLI